MEEAYVSFEIAKLLKKKGFCERCFICYEQGGEVFDGFGNWNKTDIYIAAPTHQMACAWLREVHDLYIEVVRGYDHFFVSINKMHPLREYSMKNDTFDDYDDAIEAALKYSLENLI